MTELRVKRAGQLRAAGFYAVANGYENGRHTTEWVIDHIKTSIPKRNEEGRVRAERVLRLLEADSDAPGKERSS